ncbi:MAG: shikimate dehydrogenase [Clostridia bacterium]|nr:shikimate dehydrogenase [Clostridia bacterium]
MNLYAVLGSPIAHTLSPCIHKKAFEVKGISADYIPLHMPPERLAQDIDFLRHHFSGFNCTIPLKVKILPHLAETDRAAAWLGSVNTVACRDGKLYGYSTDGYGFLSSLALEGVSLAGKRVLLLGSGGVARVIAHECASAGADVTICARNRQTGCELAETVKEHAGRTVTYTDRPAAADYDLLVNGTPVGMSPNTNDSPIAKEFLSGIPVVFDTIYAPAETLLLRSARECGAKTINGLYMLIYQALRAQEIWLDIKFTDEEVREIAAHVQAELDRRDAQ